MRSGGVRAGVPGGKCHPPRPGLAEPETVFPREGGTGQCSFALEQMISFALHLRLLGRQRHGHFGPGGGQGPRSMVVDPSLYLTPSHNIRTSISMCKKDHGNRECCAIHNKLYLKSI